MGQINLERVTPKHTWMLVANIDAYLRYQCTVCFRVVMASGKSIKIKLEVAHKMMANEDSCYGSPCFPPKE